MPSRLSVLVAAPLVIVGCALSPEPSSNFPVADWPRSDRNDASYLLAPGDTLELTVYSAPELSRSAAIGPDGRLRLPLIAPIMAAARTPEAVAAHARAAYAEELRDPTLDLLVTEFSSQQVFVGGAVASPGAFEMPGTIDPLQAILMAGGTTNDANSEIFVMRRMPGGEVRTAVLDLSGGLEDPSDANWLPLQRFDVVYVPRSAIANHNLFVQQYIRDALPIQFSLFYDVSGDSR
ncbi:MAG: polysaccharide biosynthesis/export family protein [Pseudomonadota bacterium]